MDSRNLLVDSFYVFLMLAFGPQIRFFFLLSPLSRLNGLQNIVFNQNSQKIQRPYYFTLEAFHRIHLSFLFVFVPLGQKQLIENSELTRLDNDFIPSTVAEVRVDDSEVFEKTHEFSPLDVEDSFVVTLDVQAGAEFSDRVLLGESFEVECL